ncbi:MAG TPA: radical SAM family heme chaperone HemW [Firmicutes bacterium]|nr:radical SAM family heme chaperone HemW [Bacillota bacterium]
MGREIDYQTAELNRTGRRVGTVYVGGGTPTCLSVSELCQVLEKIRLAFLEHAGGDGKDHGNGEIEFTVEANPGTVDKVKLREMRALGVNRLSFGAQAFQDRLLVGIGRIHDASQIYEGIRLARREEFANINIDLMYALPGQTMADWKETLKRAIDLDVEHISIYGLMLEEGTGLYHRVKAGEAKLADEDLEVDMYYMAKDLLESAGFEHYELSNFAQPGRRCQHNLIYWRVDPYLGIGAGAHSYMDQKRFNNAYNLEEYHRLILQKGEAVTECRHISRQEEMSDVMILGLRMLDGVDDSAFNERFGTGIMNVFGGAVSRCVESGLARWDGKVLSLTRRGLMLSNEAMREFVLP